MPSVPSVSRVLLRAGDVTVEFAPECGAALTRFDVKRGAERIAIMRPASDEHIKRLSPYGASCFPLIPYASRLREGKFEFRGRAFEFPINAPGERHSYHGDGWTRAWQINTLTRRKAIMELAADPSGPIQYHAIHTLEVDEHGLTIKLSVRNREASAIPLGLGIHPYFARRHIAIVTALLPVRWRMDSELLPVASEENLQAAELKRGLAAADLPESGAYSGWDGQALIEWPADGVRVQITTTPALRHIIVWAPENEEFFCFEPVSHGTNSFNLEREQIPVEEPLVLGPGQTWEQAFKFSVAKI